MYCAMVDENESQLTISVAVAFENVKVGVGLLEQAFQKIGEQGTWEEFNRVLERSRVPIGTTVRNKHDRNFEVVRDKFFRGEGFGRGFIETVLPSSRLHPEVISDVLNSLYGDSRAESKARQAEQEEQEAEQVEQQAQAEEDQEEAARLREEAKAKREQAKKLRQEAKRIGEGAIAPEILLKLENTYQMRQFTAAIKAAKVPKDFHQNALQHIQKTGITAGKQMIESIALWWYRESGQEGRDFRQAQEKQAYKAFRRRVKDGDLRAYLIKLCDKVRDLDSDIDITLTAAKFYEDEKHAKSVCSQLTKLRGNLDRLMADLSLERPAVQAEPELRCLSFEGDVG